jgi:hypothetical protein
MKISISYKYCFSCAAGVLLQGGPNAESHAYSMAMIDVNIKEMFEKGTNVFFDEWKENGQSLETVEAMHKIRTGAHL